MPSFVFGMNHAEPLPTYSAMVSGLSVAGIIRGRNSLADPLEVPGFRLILLLQHNPSGSAHSMRVAATGGSEKMSEERRRNGGLHKNVHFLLSGDSSRDCNF